MASRRRIRPSAWGLAALSGILQTLIFPLPDWTFLCWIAIAPLLVALLCAREPTANDQPGGAAPATIGQGFLLAWLAGIIWSSGTCYWIYSVMHIYGGLNAAVSLGVLVLFCLALGAYIGLFGIFVALAAGLGRMGRKAVILAPFLWVAGEVVRTYIQGFPWDLLGTVLVDNIPVSRIATVTGVYGLSFEILLVNAAFAAVFLVQRTRRNSILIPAILIAAVLQAGTFFQPARLPAAGTARLVQTNIPILDSDAWTSEYYRDLLRSLTDVSIPKPGELPPTEPPPQLVVWPETPAPFLVSDPAFRQALDQVAQSTHAAVVAGSLAVQSPGPRPGLFNSALVIAPDGRPVGRYDKIHLVPFGEYVPFGKLLSFADKLTREVGQFISGSEREVMDLGSYKLSVFICYESVFPGEIRQFAANGAQVLINVSNDGWFGQSAAPEQHLNQARMRAIENDRWLLRATNTGITVSIDPFGRVVARAPRNVRTTLDAPFSVITEETFYTRHGDVFAFACAIISAVALLAGVIAGRLRS